MEIEQELQNLIDEYVKQVGNKEDDLVGLQRNIDGILAMSKTDLKNVVVNLDAKFEANEISEEEYLAKLRTEKEIILKRTKEKLDALLVQYEKMSGDLDL